MTKKTQELLKQVAKNTMFVPTTTRTIEQYKRIQLGIQEPKYALVCNGGVLLIDGEKDQRWYQESLAFIKDTRNVLEQAILFLENEESRTLEVRFIEELFVFTKCSRAEEVVEKLKHHLNSREVDVFHHGVKVYVVPKALSKGKMVKRFKEYIGASIMIAAGDSEFDVSMLKEADVSFAPESLAQQYTLEENTKVISDSLIFSEEVLKNIEQYCKKMNY